MTIASFIPTVWSTALEAPYEGRLVLTQPQVANRKYEGEIADKGDTVRINAIGTPTIADYDDDVDLDIENLSTTGQDFKVDQAKSFAFSVKDLDKLQAAGAFDDQALRQAGSAMASVVDKYAAGLLTAGVPAANKAGAFSVFGGDPRDRTTGTVDAYTVVAELKRKLDANDVPLEGRYLACDADFGTALALDPRFTNASASGSTEALLNGTVGRVLGFDVLVSSNLTATGAGADRAVTILAGVADAFTFASQIVKVEAARMERRFADLVKGLNVYGAKVTRPEALASASFKYVSPTGN